jgi:ribosomal-protein-alanine N-acetyltransferase
VKTFIRPATASDLAFLLEIEKNSFSTQLWHAEDFLRYSTVVVDVDNQIAGFLVHRQTYDGALGSQPEREILNLAIAPEFRRLGLATLLLSAEISSGATYFLEVRESNIAARRLYEKLGFREVSRRCGYYQSPSETAIVMRVK